MDPFTCKRGGFFRHIENAVFARIKLSDSLIYKSTRVFFINAGDHIDVHDIPIYGVLCCDRYRHYQGFPVGSDIHQRHNAVCAAQWGCIPVNVLRGDHHDRVLYCLQDVSNRSFPQPVVIRVFSESAFRLGFVLRFCNGIHVSASYHKRQVWHSQLSVDLRRIANQKCALYIERSVQNAMYGVLILCRDLILCPVPDASLRNRILLRRGSGLAGFFAARLRFSDGVSDNLRVAVCLRAPAVDPGERVRQHLLHDCLLVRLVVAALVGLGVAVGHLLNLRVRQILRQGHNPLVEEILLRLCPQVEFLVLGNLTGRPAAGVRLNPDLRPARQPVRVARHVRSGVLPADGAHNKVNLRRTRRLEPCLQLRQLLGVKPLRHLPEAWLGRAVLNS